MAQSTAGIGGVRSGAPGTDTKEMFPVAHAKDKGAKDKHVKKKAQASIKEKRAAKKMKKEGAARPAFGNG